MRRTIPAAAILLVVILGAAALLAYTTPPTQPATGRVIWRAESLSPQDAPTIPTVWKGIEIATARVQPNAIDDYCLSSIALQAIGNRRR
jgi:hypothetical protein